MSIDLTGGDSGGSGAGGVAALRLIDLGDPLLNH